MRPFAAAAEVWICLVVSTTVPRKLSVAPPTSFRFTGPAPNASVSKYPAILVLLNCVGDEWLRCLNGEVGYKPDAVGYLDASCIEPAV